MLEVEGKTFHKFVEKKNYKTVIYDNNNDINVAEAIIDFDSFNPNNFNVSEDIIVTKLGKFKEYSKSLHEEDFEKNYGNVFAELFFQRKRVFIEEGENSISIKAQSYIRKRGVGKKYFMVRKQTNYLSFNFKTKMFYTGVFIGKNKKKISTTLKVNPSYNYIYEMTYNLRINDSISVDDYLYFFLGKIWDKVGLKNEQNFITKNPYAHYSLTKYLISGVKIPNTWLQYTDLFIPIKEIRNSNMNLIDAVMKTAELKGSKIKRILNEMESVDFDRLIVLYHMLGIDRFNKLNDTIFDSYYTSDGCGRPKEENPSGGRYWYALGKDYIKEFKEKLPELSDKEKDRITSLNSKLDDIVFNTLCEHLNMKKDLLKLGEDVKIKFETYQEFNLEHEEWSRLIDSYRKGEVERFYGEIEEIEKPIYYQEKIYYPIVLRKTIDYEQESQHQKNCVRGYSERSDCMIVSIREGSIDGNDRITVEYQFRKDHILNVQERARFNEKPSLTFSEVAKIVLETINLSYNLKTLKLPKMIKKYRNGKTIEKDSAFQEGNSALNNSEFLSEYGKMVSMVPKWNIETDKVDTWVNVMPLGGEQYDVDPYDELFNDLPH
jgi:hypothetical protein